MAWFENNNEASAGPDREPNGLCEPRCMDWPLCRQDPCPVGPLEDADPDAPIPYELVDLDDPIPYSTTEVCS